MSDHVRYDGFLPKIRLACSKYAVNDLASIYDIMDKATRAGRKLQNENREGAGVTTKMTKRRVLVIRLVEGTGWF